MTACVVHSTADDLYAQCGVGEVSCVITDPPYTEHVHDNLSSGSLVGTKSVPKYRLSFDAFTIQQQRDHIGNALRVAKRWVVSFCAVEDFGRIQDAFSASYARSGIWYKSNAMGQLTADRPATAYEGAAILHNTEMKKAWNGRGSYGIWRCNGTRGVRNRHPNQKPLDLMLKLVALFTDRGDTVLDPYCGSGTIGEACVMLDRHYIGGDTDLVWAQKAHKRVNSVTRIVTDEYALSLCTMPKVSEIA